MPLAPCIAPWPHRATSVRAHTHSTHRQRTNQEKRKAKHQRCCELDRLASYGLQHSSSCLDMCHVLRSTGTVCCCLLLCCTPLICSFSLSFDRSLHPEQRFVRSVRVWSHL